MLSRSLLAASRSRTVRGLITGIPVTRRVVDRFVAGERLDEASPVIQSLIAEGLTVTVDRLGEDTPDASNATITRNAYLTMLKRFTELGVADRAEVSVKLSALGQKLPRDGAQISLENAMAKTRFRIGSVRSAMRSRSVWSLTSCRIRCARVFRSALAERGWISASHESTEAETTPVTWSASAYRARSIASSGVVCCSQDMVIAGASAAFGDVDSADVSDDTGHMGQPSFEMVDAVGPDLSADRDGCWARPRSSRRRPHLSWKESWSRRPSPFRSRWRRCSRDGSPSPQP